MVIRWWRRLPVTMRAAVVGATIAGIFALLVALLPQVLHSNGDVPGSGDSYAKFQALMAYQGGNSAVSVSLIEDIANSRDPRREDYLKSFRQERTNMSLIEGQAVELALASSSKNGQLKDTYDTLWRKWKEENRFDEKTPTQRLVLTVLYLDRSDSEAYQSTVEELEKALGETSEPSRTP